MKQFKKYVNESSGIGAWQKYFMDKEVITTIKKTSPIWINNKKTDDVLEMGEEIIIPSSSIFQKGKISVLYKGVPTIIQFANIVKPTKKGGEQLNIQATKLLKTAKGRSVTIGSKTFPAKVFYNPVDVSTTVQNGIQLIKTIPDDLKNILSNYLSQSKYQFIDWQGYDNKQFKNEIAKYLGEILIGLCVMNGEYNVLTGVNPFKGKKIKEFIMPTDSSFAGVDSMFNTFKGEVIPISSKSGKGAPASFHANVMPVLIGNNIKTSSPILKFMIDSMKSNYTNIEFLYNIGMNYIMKKQLKGKLGDSIKSNPISIYKNLSKNIIGEPEQYVLDIVSNPKNNWPIMKNQKAIISKLPGSFTYFICQNIAELINKDKKALESIMIALSSKNFYQANLNQAKFHKGQLEFKMIHSGKNTLKMKQGKGSMKSVKSEQGRLSYEIS